MPLEWFFSFEVSSGSEAAVPQFDNVVAELVRGRNFPIVDDVVLDDFYLLWKGMFNQQHGVETLICLVNSCAGVKKLSCLFGAL